MGQTINLPPLATGIILLILAGVVVIGGVHRLAKVTEKLVPCMAFFYIIGGLIAIGINYDMILPSISYYGYTGFYRQCCGWWFCRMYYCTSIPLGARQRNWF